MPTCLPAVEEHADDLDDSDETEAGEEREAEHVQLLVRPVDLHRGVLSHHLGDDDVDDDDFHASHLGGDVGDGVVDTVLASGVPAKV